MEHVRDSTKTLRLLSELLLASPFSSEASSRAPSIETQEMVSELGPGDLEDLEALASTNHVIMRAFAPLQDLLAPDGNNQGAEWLAISIQRETTRINHALDKLTPRERMVFELKHYQGLKLRTIGEILNTTEETAKNTLFRATQKLRGSLADMR